VLSRITSADCPREAQAGSPNTPEPQMYAKQMLIFMDLQDFVVVCYAANECRE
jgi:hypothetical protein